MERGAAAPPLSSECEQVDELLKPETSHASAQGVRGSKKPLSRWPEDMLQRNLHCSTYNINIHRGCLEPAVLRKLLSKTRPGTPLPLPRPPKKKHPQPTRKRLLIKSPSPVRCPRNRFPGPSPSVNPCIGPHAKDSHPKPASDCVLTPSRARISSPPATAREQQPHHAPPRNVTFVIRDALRTTKSHPKTSRSIIPPPSAMRSRARAMGQGSRLLAPVRGLIRPSIPLPFHWRPETRSQTFSPRAMDFFFFQIIEDLRHQPKNSIQMGK